MKKLIIAAVLVLMAISGFAADTPTPTPTDTPTETPTPTSTPTPTCTPVCRTRPCGTVVTLQDNKPTHILGPNANRAYLRIANESDTAVYVALEGIVPATNSMIHLNPATYSGDYIEFKQGFGYVPIGGIAAIVTGSNKKISICELDW